MHSDTCRAEALAEVRTMLRRRAGEAETRTAAALAASVRSAVAAAVQVARAEFRLLCLVEGGEGKKPQGLRGRRERWKQVRERG